MKNKFIKSTLILIIGGCITKILGLIIKIIYITTEHLENREYYMKSYKNIHNTSAINNSCYHFGLFPSSPYPICMDPQCIYTSVHIPVGSQ